MSAETNKPSRNTNNPPDQPQSKGKGKSKASKPRQTVELPFLVELSYSLPVIIILMVDFAIIGFSYTSGSDWVTTLSRAMVATVVIGGLLIIIAYVISSTALAEVKERLEKEKNQKNLESLNGLETEMKEIRA
jgi:hypothetical protein